MGEKSSMRNPMFAAPVLSLCMGARRAQTATLSERASPPDRRRSLWPDRRCTRDSGDCDAHHRAPAPPRSVRYPRRCASRSRSNCTISAGLVR
jgi:hypothetical protein